MKRSPLLGEHTDEILRQVLGFSDHQVKEIHDSGALDPPRKRSPPNSIGLADQGSGRRVPAAFFFCAETVL